MELERERDGVEDAGASLSDALSALRSYVTHRGEEHHHKNT